MKKVKKKKGLHPAVAVGIFVVAAGFAAKSFLGMANGPAPSVVGDTASAPAEAAATTAAPADGPDCETIAWKDLLAVHGSYDRKAPVRLAFSTLAELEHVAPAPSGETRPIAAGRWTGVDPPAIHVGVVMISAAARRAVIDGRVVGVGDPIGDTTIAAIERDVVTLKMGAQLLTYDFDDAYPREFRSEQSLREVERAQKAAEEAAAAARTDQPASVDDKAAGQKDGGATIDKLLEQSAAKKPPEEVK